MMTKPVICRLRKCFASKEGPFSAVLAASQQKNDLEKQIFTQF